jgi:hypothetical protein
MSDDLFAMTARTLADVLIRFARDRQDNDKKAIAVLQTELCRLRRAEIAAIGDAARDALSDSSPPDSTR